MKYFYIYPEVPGGIGQGSVVDNTVQPPVVKALEYEFDGWPCDVLLTSSPRIYLVTDDAKQALQAHQVSGVSFDEFLATTSEEYQLRHPDQVLPHFAWLKIDGVPGKDDFGIDPDWRLVISQRVLDILTPKGLANADIDPYPA